MEWWIGGLVEWNLAAWGLEVLHVTSSTRDRDGSADLLLVIIIIISSFSFIIVI